MLKIREGMDTTGFYRSGTKPVTVPVLDIPGTVELRIVNAHLAWGETLPFERLDGYGLVNVHNLVAQLRDAERRGVRVAVVVIDSTGGVAGAAFRLYEALQRFRQRGGYVVAYIHGNAASSASYPWLAADYVVVGYRASIWVHGARNNPAEAEAFAQVTARTRAILEAETIATTTQIEEWIGTPARPFAFSDPVATRVACIGGVILDTHDALALGFADEVGGWGRAESAALCAVYGDPMPSPRRERLATRGVVVSVTAESDTTASAGADLPQTGDGYTPQEAGTSATIPTFVDGLKMGVGDSVVVPTTVPTSDVGSNLIPNPQLTIWEHSVDPDQVPPNAWEVGVLGPAGALGPTDDGWRANPNLWVAGKVFHDGRSLSGDLSMKVTLDASDGANGRGLRSRLFPVSEGDVYDYSMTIQADNSGAAPGLTLLFYAADGLTFIGSAGSGYSFVGQPLNSWVNYRGTTGRVPAGARWARAFALVSPVGALVTGPSGWVDEVGLKRAIPWIKRTGPFHPIADPAYAANTWARVAFANGDGSANADWDSTTNGRATYTVHPADNRAYATFAGQLSANAATAGTTFQVGLYRAGVRIAASEVKTHDGTNILRCPFNFPGILLDSGVTFELWMMTSQAGGPSFATGTADTWLSIKRDAN